MIPIFVVKYRNPEIEQRCIDAVREYALADGFVLVVVDNGQADLPLAVVWNDQIRTYFDDDATPDDDPAFVLLNTDAFLRDPDSLSVLAKAVRASAQVAAAGPLTDNAGSIQAIRHAFWYGFDKPNLGRPGGAYQGQVLIDDHISGFCLMVRLAAWKDVGGFPEDGPFYGQESAFIESAWAKGWHTVVCLDAFVEHLGGATAKKYLDQDEERKKGAVWFRKYRKSLTGG